MPTTPAPTRRRAVLAGILLVSTTLLVVGLWRTWTVPFGWFAYAPLSQVTYGGGAWETRLPTLLVLVGALGVGAVAGYALGRRRS
ncbi:hypothetical protein [Cellulomonas fimi]|uniref:Uncharacterized protein n=1 Tax=Cellulomonas fimi (strain ATCC 484 / DSM 20113 / JCM 1341 / CCUG 24087 / LMG 16345 / NBRC 15513 / NCIMB 8980 / NCTC 7547 / NRS-133) TaxID=590998 RepID=F4GZY8_CELFA|nr:hypothetical protein [Cellulomonas fimi]AEE44910.1 hypothetical protein Celf_0770 [Cellulomonas fimi ATCC 484]NNH08282.1 hypothetical protein [Cellulomonas fimi]VEH27652.1 Uncharacterised protein [Cellulomonas fimi]